MDAETLRDAAEATGRLITVEDHWAEGGLGDAFADGRPAPRLLRRAVRTMPGSAAPGEQLREVGIDADAIVAAARHLAGSAAA